ncbi:hypothetical protein Vafri_18572 [Volvox africanus]|nr:hypothetical protein Vafri_18572 [Volvox africanus]
MSGAAVWFLHVPFIAFFTRDPVVVAHVLAALPMLCVFFPIDAAAAIMDGSLLAAKQSNYMSAVQIAGSVVQYFVLAYLAAAGNINSLTVWSALKILIVCRVVGGVVRNYYSPKSGYKSPAVVAAVSPAVTAEVAVSQRAATDVPPAGVVAATVSPPPQPAVPPGDEELRAELAAVPAAPATATGAPSPSVLQSIEDDMMVLAFAACTSATDMNPDMLSLKRRQTAVSNGAAATAAYRISTGIGNGDTSSGTPGANSTYGGEGGGGSSAAGASAAAAAGASNTSAAAG